METIGIELTRIFVKVIQHGSFSKAADSLKIPKSTVSKAISKLERETGTKLLLRTTRSQTLTASGRAFYETCLEPLQVLEDAQKSLFGKDAIVAGKIKITAPEDLGTHVIAPIIGELSQNFDKLSFELYYTNEVVDLVRDGFDFAVRIGTLKQSGLKAKRIGEVTLIPVASPQYLEKRGKINSPQDLTKHDCLSISGLSVSHRWDLKNKQQTAKVLVSVKTESNQMTSLLQVALAGGGVALVPSYLVKELLQSKKLIRVLPGWSNEGFPVSLVSPVSMSSSARLKLVSEKIFTASQKALSEDL
ncbi:LysR family transcriptional regulator [Bdellovibrio sp. qaytius]|nr:LysR family transcriptional regulator [Bdellovibrio sp. qaytius]